jgi:hypothetical protein
MSVTPGTRHRGLWTGAWFCPLVLSIGLSGLHPLVETREQPIKRVTDGPLPLLRRNGRANVRPVLGFPSNRPEFTDTTEYGCSLVQSSPAIYGRTACDVCDRTDDSSDHAEEHRRSAGGRPR